MNDIKLDDAAFECVVKEWMQGDDYKTFSIKRMERIILSYLAHASKLELRKPMDIEDVIDVMEDPTLPEEMKGIFDMPATRLLRQADCYRRIKP